MNLLYPSVAERADNRCEYCRASEQAFNFPFQVDHIIPQARGGSDHLDNLALACPACNLFKSDFQTAWDEDTQANAALFHPRHEEWTQHFRFNSESAEIVGLSPAGRATITRLQMNLPRHVAVRRRWMEWGIYP